MLAKSVEPSQEQIALAEAQIVEQSKRIDFFLTEYSVELLAQKVRDNEYVVPAYQRAFTWEDERKSRFIESLIMGLPIPFLFFWEMPDGRLEIVDGSQRLRTLEQFIYDGFRLTELSTLTNLSGCAFNDLPASRQRKIRNRPIRGIVLNEDADEAARLDMFERINTGSKIANTAEIRRGALAGPFLDLVTELAELPSFAALAPMTKKAKDERGYEELVTRFFAYGDGLGQYRDRPADFAFSYSKKMNAAFSADSSLAESYRQRFVGMLGFVERVFPYGFKRSAKGKFTPRARFEAIAIGSDLAIRENGGLLSATARQVNVAEWIGDSEFDAIVGSDGANAVARLRGRIEYVRDRLVSSNAD
ncbi:DUF262 domain-containing protein [Mycolicibacterium sp. P9-22]|uniref:DUF262 domain-containing protein n=1 Tax=Mycolicibacterium sp. P9-22 TaxID=2024613 RepID=UPI0011EED051|nr:DUF262 domain-containing protein [Mycolicibacterium sp. P9-22]KAA0115094.1 DUF262 domain-containing protein [Mycolicibacterium sp. P9-22]